MKMIFEPIITEGVAPLIISGPCSAESESQMLATARPLSAMGIPIFRAGVWKVRTRPGGFEGYGIDALKWLQIVKAETGMSTATEVGTTEHLESALKYGVDILWIGARTVSDPFAVQRLADALKGIDIPVMIKNPIAPDVDLWLGAVERIYGAGIRRMATIFRGFCCYPPSEYRNPPIWAIAAALKERIPTLPMLFDPSHSTGRRDMIAAECRKALSKGFDGLMVESHHNPDTARTDRRQQLTPESLKQMLQDLKIL